MAHLTTFTYVHSGVRTSQWVSPSHRRHSSGPSACRASGPCSGAHTETPSPSHQSSWRYLHGQRATIWFIWCSYWATRSPTWGSLYLKTPPRVCRQTVAQRRPSRHRPCTLQRRSAGDTRQALRWRSWSTSYTTTGTSSRSSPLRATSAPTHTEHTWSGSRRMSPTSSHPAPHSNPHWCFSDPTGTDIGTQGSPRLPHLHRS